MKKIIFILFSLILFVSCESKEQVKGDITELTNQRNALQGQTVSMQLNIIDLTSQTTKLTDELKVLNILKSGKQPVYVIKLKLKQSHISLSISKHLKDMANAIEFEMPVDKEYYNSVNVGTEIVDNFRMGSLFFAGSFGSWEMTVINKYVK